MSFEINDLGSLVWRNEKGEFHRENGPSIIFTSGGIRYALNNRLHRLDGPAVVHSNVSKSCYIHGIYYSKEDYLAKVKQL